jgi:tryptophan 2,3-dioxygenase
MPRAASAHAITYSSYLQLDTLLGCQRLESAKAHKPAHDEMLFIITHQTYELWFKQILHELDAVVAIMGQPVVPERELGQVLHYLERIVVIQKVLVEQIGILETMTPLDFLDFRDLRRLEVGVLLHHGEHIPPGGQAVQLHADVGEDLLRLREDVVVEVHEHVVDHGARVAQRLAEVDLGAAVGGQVLDQQGARALADVALDLRVAAEALRLLAHVLHRQAEPVGDPRRVGNAGGLAARHHVELLEAGVARQC